MTSEKIFRDDSYLTELEANVASCVQKDDHYEVILDKTIFYPHMSGGQPRDEGRIGGVKVIDVQERGDEIVHITNEPVGGNVRLSINFGIRFDYMQQHTGQHILSYAFAELFGGNTVGFHLSENYTTIDLDILLTDEMVASVERLSNRIIYEDKKVTAKDYSYDEALKLNLKKVPVELDRLRIVSIENYDDNACGGTHVNYTGEIGIIKVTKTEKYKKGTRVEFLCGQRALDDYAMKNKSISDLTAMLSCRVDMLLDNLEKVLNENKRLNKDIGVLNGVLNGYKAMELKNEAIARDGISYVFNKSDDDVKGLRDLCSKLIEGDGCVAVLVSERDNTCNVVIGQSKNLSLDMKSVFEQCKTIINGKGGGNNYLLQCSGDLLKANECLELARTILIR